MQYDLKERYHIKLALGCIRGIKDDRIAQKTTETNKVETAHREAMKFGRMLQHVSIPEWKEYNIEYNDLKQKIRRLTEEDSYTEEELYDDFLFNFRRVSLFISMQRQVIARRVATGRGQCRRILADERLDVVSRQIALDEALVETMSTSVALKKLIQFILVQKIACRKLFKKFMKHYAAKVRAKRLVTHLRAVLERSKNSFVTIDVSPLTLELTMWSHRVNYERDKLCKLSKHNPPGVLENISSQGSSFGDRSFEKDYELEVRMFLKKNFRLSFLFSDDSHQVNEVILNLNIHLGLDNCDFYNSSHKTSYIYLCDRSCITNEPSIIISEEGRKLSLVFSYTGGLRKISHCCLPNTYLQELLVYLSGRSPEEQPPALPQALQFDRTVNLCINSILESNLAPMLKVVFNRHKFALPARSPCDDNENTNFSSDYLLIFDQDIMTTSNPDLTLSLDFNVNYDFFETFPFSKLVLASNDAWLFNFNGSLNTTIANGKLENKFSTGALKKLPEKIQQLIQMNKSRIFKNFDLYRYMLSCYFNIIPSAEYLNNHFSNILNLNLLKFLENEQLFDLHKSLEDKIIRDNSHKVLKHQSSLRSFHSERSPLLSDHNDATSYFHSVRSSQSPVLDISGSSSEDDAENKETLINYSDLIYLRSDFSDTLFNRIVFSLLKFRQLSSKLLGGSDYSSIQNNELGLSALEEYQYLFEIEYDRTLSFLYFILAFLSLFISGVIMGVVNSILTLEQDSQQFNFGYNMGLIFILSAGIVLSLSLSLTSFQLLYKRLGPLPVSHNIIVFISLTTSVISVISFILVLAT